MRQRPLLAAFYGWVRRTFWKDFDPNEDFTCTQCGKPVYRRILFCSDKCYRLSDWAHRRNDEN
jgi:hypothetical protein